jgi:hypothetical protein
MKIKNKHWKKLFAKKANSYLGMNDLGVPSREALWKRQGAYDMLYLMIKAMGGYEYFYKSEFEKTLADMGIKHTKGVL